MAEYEYKPLDLQRKEIRLLILLPSSHGDPIRTRIIPALLPDETVPQPTRVSIDEIRASLPHGWNAFETLGGRVLFQTPDKPLSTTWDHPDPTFPRQKYCGPLAKSPQQHNPAPSIQWEALSYQWGDDLDTETAEVEEPLAQDLGKRSHVRIRKNLADALRHLRHADKPRTLWVDSLCINQRDGVERSAQVLHMGSIYSRAKSVIIWLGSTAAQSGKAMSTLSFLATQVEYTPDTQFLPAPGCTKPDWYLMDSDLGFDGETLTALYDLFGRSWFQRLWVLQEAQLASSESVVKCGHDEVPWPLFRRAVLCLVRRTKGLPRGFRMRLAAHARFTVDFLKRAPMEELLSISSGQHCSDQRDRIYGILKIAPLAFGSLCIRPDYGVDKMDVYRRAFLAHCGHYRRLTLLQHCGDPEGVSPTWVPDWAHAINFHASYYGCQASGLSDPAFSVVGNHLQVWAVVISKVCSVETADITSMGDLVRYIERVCIKSLMNRQHPCGDTVFDALIQSVAYGRTSDRMPILGYPAVNEIREFLETLLEHKNNNGHAQRRTLHDRFESETFARLKGKSIIALDGGEYTGVAPGIALKGKSLNWDLCQAPSPTNAV
jgi:hypothetical protein